MFKLISVFVLVAVSVATINAADTETVKFTNIFCDFVSEYVSQNLTCKIKSFRNKTRTFTIKLLVIKLIEDPIVNVAVFRKANGYKPSFVNASQSACEFLSGKGNNPFVKILAEKWIKPSLSIPVTCPICGRVELVDVKVNPKDIPSVIPPGDYMIQLIFYFKNPFFHIGEVRVHFTIDPISFLTV